MGQRVEAAPRNGGDAVYRPQVDGGIAHDRAAEGIHEQGDAAGTVGGHSGQQGNRHKGKDIGMQVHRQHPLHQPGKHRCLLHNGTIAHHDRDEHHRKNRTLNPPNACLKRVFQEGSAHQQDKQGDGKRLSIDGGLE